MKNSHQLSRRQFERAKFLDLGRAKHLLVVAILVVFFVGIGVVNVGEERGGLFGNL